MAAAAAASDAEQHGMLRRIRRPWAAAALQGACRRTGEARRILVGGSEMSATAQSIDADSRRAGADGRLSSRHRRAQAQRHQDDLRRARHPDHGLRPHGAGRRHPRHLVPARAERRQRRGHRRLPDEEARHLPHGVGARLPQRPDRAGQRHDQLLSDDPDLAARPSARSSTCSRATTRRWTSWPSPSRSARRPSACCMPPTSASAWRARSARRSRAVRAASISICRPSCSRR